MQNSIDKLARLDVIHLMMAVDAERQSADLSWKDVAAQTGVAPSSLTRMCQGKHPDADNLLSLLEWLGVDHKAFLVAS